MTSKNIRNFCIIANVDLPWSIWAIMQKFLMFLLVIIYFKF